MMRARADIKLRFRDRLRLLLHGRLEVGIDVQGLGTNYIKYGEPPEVWLFVRRDKKSGTTEHRKVPNLAATLVH